MALQTLPPPSAQRRAHRGRRRSTAFWVGIALVAAGLALLGYVAWQFFGTNIVSRREQRQIVERTQRIWSHGGSTTGTGQGQGVHLAGAEALIRIPSFGEDLVPVQEGVTPTVLAQGFGHFRGTARAGQVGNFALAAHRVTHGEPLRKMPTLRPGDTVVVETRTHSFTYRIDTDPNRLVVAFTDIWVVSPVPHNPHGGVQPAQRPGQRLITLTTCSELFHTDNRMIAFGHLVGSRSR